jgi:thiol-disulfide isomerase/thioredoxin
MIYYLEGFDIDMNNKMLLASLLPEYKDKKFVVMVKAEWCGHCKVATPVFENAAKEMENSSDTLYCIADITSDPDIKDKIYWSVDIEERRKTFFYEGIITKDEYEKIKTLPPDTNITLY